MTNKHPTKGEGVWGWVGGGDFSTALQNNVGLGGATLGDPYATTIGPAFFFFFFFFLSSLVILSKVSLCLKPTGEQKANMNQTGTRVTSIYLCAPLGTHTQPIFLSHTVIIFLYSTVYYLILKFSVHK